MDADALGKLTLEASADTWVAMSWWTLVTGEPDPAELQPPHGGERALVVGSHDEHRGGSFAFVDFDLSHLSTDLHVESAWLEMYAEKVYGGPMPAVAPLISVYFLEQPWDEATLDVLEMPIVDRYDRGPVAATRATEGEWMRWDVSSAVRRMHESGSGAGFWIDSYPDGWVVRFSSREADQPPRLVMNVSADRRIAPLHIPFAVNGSWSPAPLPRPRSLPTPDGTMIYPQLPAADADGRPSIELTLADNELIFGGVPELSAEWVNHTDESTTLILPVDGSTLAWRMPIYVWRFTRPDGREIVRRQYGRCGNVNPLYPADFVELQPDDRIGTVRADGGGDWLQDYAERYSFLDPGVYEVDLVYALDKEGGIVPPAIVAPWAAARPMTVVSAPVRFTVAEPEGRYAVLFQKLGELREGMNEAEVLVVLGEADQHFKSAYYPDQNYWVYYLAGPMDGEPAELADPLREGPWGYNWRPRLVVTFDADEIVAETGLLP